MRAVVQRVSRARVLVGDDVVGAISHGLLVYAAVAVDDGVDDLVYIADKVTHLRVFRDSEGRQNRAVAEVGGAVLLVSAFTVLADARRGRRPSFDASADGPTAGPLIADLAERMRASGLPVATGRFAADMSVEAVNDGPICVLLDSRRVI